MKITRVEISNILSIEYAVVEFDESGLMLVQGWNYDSGRANGAGKTAIFNAISYALYDKLPRKVTATEILRRGSTAGYVEVCLESVSGTYTVRRSRPKNVVYSKRNEDNTLGRLTITQAEWESILKLNYNQFMIVAYCSQQTATRFLSINDGDKKQFLLQLLSLEGFASCKKIADDKVDTLEDELALLNSKISAIDSKEDAYSESLVDENVINHHINLADQLIVDLTSSLIAAQSVPKPDLSKYQQLEDDIIAKKTELTKVKMKREMFHDQFRRMGTRLIPFDADATCHACGASLDNRDALEAYNKDMASLKEEIAKTKESIDKCDETLTGEAKINELQTKVRQKKRAESLDWEIASIKVVELRAKIAMKQKEVKDWSLKLLSNSELLSKIKVLNDERTKITDGKAFISRDIELYKTVAAMYSTTGAQAYILDSVIESFNERIEEYINLLWSDVSYELLSYKENVSGDVTAKFSEQLVMHGHDVSIGSLSGGEFRALSLCADFALISVMERQCGIHISPVIFDEPYDGLDGAGKELITELLEKLSGDRLIVTVDHSSEVKSMFSKVLTVEKRNGISTVKLET